MARRDFIDALPAELVANVHVGRIILPSGEVSSEHASLMPPCKVVVRGDLESTKHVCARCDAFLYFPMPFQFRYVLRGTFDEEKAFHVTHINSLLVRDDLAVKLRKQFRRYVQWSPMRIQERPADLIQDFPEIRL
jgi:hypothetical protein